MNRRWSQCLLLTGLSLTMALPVPQPEPLKRTFGIPIPSEDVLKWTQMEIGMMITFNMATFLPNCTGNGLCATVGGCKGYLPPVDTFNPKLLDTDQWVETMVSYGAKYAILVAQHCGGFSMFKTNDYVLKATGFNYTYSVDFTSWGGGNRDVMAEFVASCRKYGLRPAVYYSLNHNYYLNVGNGKVMGGDLLPGQANISQSLYEQIALAQYTQLLTLYGDMAEIWFDGGMDVIPGFADLVRKTQPHAVYLNGEAAANNVRWVGTESGTPSYPIWSTNDHVGTAGAGEPNGTVFNPAETDTTLYQIDHWFWSPLEQFQIRTLAQLQEIYHSSVGQNSQLMMNLTPDDTGLVPATHVARYKQVGDWVRACYGDANRVAHGTTTTTTLTLLVNTTVDRVVILEDLSLGERILAYSLTDDAGVSLGNGTAVGNKRIQPLSRSLPAGQHITLTVQQTVEHTAPSVSLSAYGPCDDLWSR